MSVREVAEYLAVHEMTLYALIHDTDIPAMKLGGQWRFKKSLLDEWLDKEMNRERVEETPDEDFPEGPAKTGTGDR